MLIKVLALVESTYEAVGKPVEDGSVGDLVAQVVATRLSNVLGRGLLQAEMPAEAIQNTVVAVSHLVAGEQPVERLKSLLDLTNIVAGGSLPVIISLLSSALGRSLRELDNEPEAVRVELTKWSESILTEYKTLDLKKG